MNSSLQQRLALFPATTKVVGEGEYAGLAIAGCNLADLAECYDTPLYVFDAATLDAAAQSYAAALRTYYPAEAGITYAGKAFLNRAVARWAHQRGLWVDCTGVGEIAVAVAAGVPRKQLLVHGVNKSFEDLAAAVEHAGVVVVDNLSELQRLATLCAASQGNSCHLAARAARRSGGNPRLPADWAERQQVWHGPTADLGRRALLPGAQAVAQRHPLPPRLALS